MVSYDRTLACCFWRIITICFGDVVNHIFSKKYNSRGPTASFYCSSRNLRELKYFVVQRLLLEDGYKFLLVSIVI
jgi:hypothetical protein